MECGNEVRVPVRRAAVEETDHRHRRLLRVRREWPCGYTAAEKRDEFPPPHGAHPEAKDHELTIARASQQTGRSASCQMQKSTAGKFHYQPPFTSFDHLVHGGEKLRRHFEAECSGRLHVDDELEFGRLHHRQVDWLRTFEDFAGIDAHLTKR